MTNTAGLFATHLVLVSVALALAGCAAAYSVHVLRARCRRKNQELRELRNREWQRAGYCGTFGHHLDPSCLCTRCLTAQHDYTVIATHKGAIGCELVNPRADPGALYLDSNFQPDPDYGVTQTIYRVERTFRCGRCGHERQTVEEEKVIDEP